MKALITGASSGIGRDMARYLSKLGYDLILVARSKEKLEELKEELNTNIKVIPLDLGNINNCNKLYEKVKDDKIDILINNAGFGDIGSFRKTDVNKELNMIDLNIKAVHVLTKLFLDDFVKGDSGYILNVASSAAFQPGPLMATYYATKSYVYNLTLAIYEELRRMNSKVSISCLCPGPVDTNFNNVAGVHFSVKAMTSKEVAHYAIDQMFKKKTVIIPGFKMKLALFGRRFVSRKMLRKITYNIQKSKQN